MGLILQNLPTLVGNSVPLAIAVVVLILACFRRRRWIEAAAGQSRRCTDVVILTPSDAQYFSPRVTRNIPHPA